MPPAVQLKEVYPENGWYVLWSATDSTVPPNLQGTYQRILMWGLGTDNLTVEPFVNDGSGNVVQALTISTAYTLEHPLQYTFTAGPAPMLIMDAVSSTGPGASQDLGVQARSLTMHVVSASDPNSLVALEGSLDNNNWWGIGSVIGTGYLNNDQDVVQYVRANVMKLASGDVTVYIGFA